MADDDKKAVTTKVIDWAAGQPFNNVLLLLILAGGGWIAYYTVTTAIPAHLQQIQQGYQHLAESHKEERERTLQTYDKWMSRDNAQSSRASPVAVNP